MCEVANAHGKTIYGLRVAPAGVEETILTCSSDNTIKSWKFDAESNQLTEVKTIQQFEGATEEISRQMLGLVCFEENGALQTIGVNLGGDLVMTSGGAHTSTIIAQKDRPDATAVGPDQTVYVSSETFIYAMKNGNMTRVSGITSNEKMKVLVSNEHSVYAGSVTGYIQKINGESVSAQCHLGEFEVLDISVSSDKLYVLSNRK